MQQLKSQAPQRQISQLKKSQENELSYKEVDIWMRLISQKITKKINKNSSTECQFWYDKQGDWQMNQWIGAFKKQQYLSCNYFTAMLIRLATVNLTLGKCKCPKSSLSDSVSSGGRNDFGARRQGRAPLLSSLPASLEGRRAICASVCVKNRKYS